MTIPQGNGLVGRGELPDAERQAVEDLRTLCNAADGLKLKLNVDGPPSGAGASDRFLYWAAGQPVAFCSLDGDSEVEICGMVHPDYRRRGIGRALLAAALAECRRRVAESALLICERQAAPGQALVVAMGGRYAFGEHHMELDARRPLPEAALRPGDPALILRRADEADAGTLAEITAGAFEGSVERVRERIAEDLADPARQWWFLAHLAGTPVGSLKVYPWGADQAGIYAFGVLPDYRGRGLGRQILVGTIALLAAEGRPHLSLEVDTENTPALTLYQHCGFETTTTYGYYTIPLDT